MNQEQHLDIVRDLVADLGLEIVELEEVSILLSLRIAEDSEKAGVRHFHLLYFSSAVLSRSMELEDVLRKLQRALVEFRGLTTKAAAFLPGFVVDYRGERVFFPESAKQDSQEVRESLLHSGGQAVANAYLVVNENGKVTADGRPNSLEAGVSTIYFLGESVPEQTELRTLSPAETATKLLALSVNGLKEPGVVLKSVAQLAQNAKGFDYSQTEGGASIVDHLSCDQYRDVREDSVV